MNNKNRASTILVLATAIFLLTASTAYALVNWDSGYVFVYNDGSQLKLAEGVTATFTESANTGATVTFTDLAVNDAAASNVNISLTDISVAIVELDFTDIISFNVAEGSGTFQITSPVTPSFARIDNVLKDAGDGWTYTDGTLTVTNAANTIAFSFTSSPPEPSNEPGTAQGAWDGAMAAIWVALAVIIVIPIVVAALALRRGEEMDREQMGAFLGVTILIIIVVIVSIVIVNAFAGVGP